MVDFTTSQTPLSALESIAKIASPNFRSSRMVYGFWLQSLARELLPKERVAKCLRAIIPTASTVDVCRQAAAARAYYRNLMTCGRIWHCPVCASRITEERRRELTEALEASNLTPVLVTYTLRHSVAMKLPDVLAGLLAAFRALKSGKGWKLLTEDYSWVGSVRALEVTYGVNGWHPHIHELVLLQQPLSAAQQRGLETALKMRWERVLQRQGYSASYEHGVDVESRDSNIREYVAKFGHEPENPRWTLEHELTKAPVKKGRSAGRTPTQLLADYGEGDIAAGRLWREYALTFKGRNQLVWSRGLRDLLDMSGEVSDELLAADVPPEAVLLARLTPDQWRAVLRADMRGELLDQAAVGSAEGFSQWLADLLEKWMPPQK
jgi:hypothetical protein